MRKAFCIAAVLAVLLSTAHGAAANQTAVELPDIAPSRTAPIVFVDVLKQSSPWRSASQVATDSEGNVLALARGQTAERTVFAAAQRHPAGDYVLLYDGRGAFAFAGATVVERAPGRIVARVSQADDNAELRLVMTSTDPANHPRNVRLILPGFESAYAQRPLYPPFANPLSGASALRFAQWSRAATLSTSQVWPLRPRVSRATQADGSGVAPEYEIALANQTGVDPWFVFPVGATDAYVYGTADLIHRFLDPRLHPIFEYGDRVDDPRMPVNAYARMAAQNTGIAGTGQAAALGWYAVRSRQICAIARNAFAADAARVDCVTATGDTAQATNPLRSWVRVTQSLWLGSAASHERVVPPARTTFAVGDDTAPPQERRGRPLIALHVMPLVSARMAAPLPPRDSGVSGSIGDPLAEIDLTREGDVDWVAATGSGALERKATGAQRIGVFATAPQATVHKPGFATLAWSDGASIARGSAIAGSFTGAGGVVRITAPADRAARVLRIYLGAVSARVHIEAQLEGASFTDSSLAQARGLREGVYTLVYRARGPSHINVDLSAVASGSAPAGLNFRGATLTLYEMPSKLYPFDEKTYHNDRQRLGWNFNEQILNTANVASSSFGLVRTFHVDGNVLAQPLYLSNYIMHSGKAHNILIVATEHDSIYEFDVDTGATLNKVSLGKAESSYDVGCLDIRPEYGISSTPTIDRARGTIYVVAATEPNPYDFHTTLHALEIDSLADIVPPVDIAATATLSNGSTISFDPQNQMNRSGLAQAGDSIYVGIGSHCDNNASNITGWILRYDFKLNKIGQLNTVDDPSGYFLSSVWMSGFAPAIDDDGTIFVVTGNGAFDLNVGGKNYGESVLKAAPDLSKFTGYFTPKNWRSLNAYDTDFGSGGVMLLPRQQASYPVLAVAQGKFSTIYLLNRARLGQLHDGDTGALQSIPNTGGGVWGGPAYYSGPTGQFVYYQAGGAPLLAFSLGTNQNGVPQLTLSSSGPSYSGYGGSLPVVSSNGQQPGTGIVWLINRSRPLLLEAYDATDVSHLLFSGNAGVWKNPQANGFVTPLVAGGRVYVPSTNEISVFGLGSARRSIVATQVQQTSEPIEHQLHGTIVAVAGNILRLRQRDGRTIAVDITQARAARHTGVLPIGGAIVAYGLIDRTGKFRVTSIGHTSPDPSLWPPDM